MKNGKYSASNKRRRSWRMKPTALLVAVLMLALVTFGSTMAYLIDTSGPLENTFKPGKVEISVNEPGWETDKTKKENVTIINNGDVPVKIRAKIVATWQKLGEDGKYVIYPEAPVAGTDYTINIPTDTDWSGPDAKGWYTHTSSVEPHDSADPTSGQTDVLIASCAPKTENTPEGYHLVVDIIAEAIQAEGITAGSHPWGE